MLYIAYYVIYNISKGDMIFEIVFFKEDDGTKPLAVFIKSLDVKLKAKVVANLHLLEEYGDRAREPLSKYLGNGIFELRSKEGNNIVRILYFFDKGKIIIATNGFVKKTQKTPKSEIELAVKRRNKYFSERSIYE